MIKFNNSPLRLVSQSSRRSMIIAIQGTFGHVLPLEVKVGGRETDDGRAGRTRRAVRRSIETAQNIGRGLLGRLRRRR